MPLRLAALFSLVGLTLTLGCPDVSNVPYTDPALVADDGYGLEKGDAPPSDGDAEQAAPTE